MVRAISIFFAMASIDVEEALAGKLSNPVPTDTTDNDGNAVVLGPFVVQKTIESNKKPSKFVMVAVDQVGEERESTSTYNYSTTIMIVGPGAGGRFESLEAHKEYRAEVLDALDAIFGDMNRLNDQWKLTTVEELTPIFESVNGIDDVPISGWRANLQGN